MVGGLHPWPRARRDPPPGHSRVPGGGRTAADRGLLSRPALLGHLKPLSGLCRATFRAARPQTALFPRVEAPVWTKDGVVHWEPVGRGAEACRYLAPDSLRGALSHHRSLTRHEGHVTLQSKASATAQVNTGTLPAEALMRRCRPHVRPASFIQGRDDGVRSPTTRQVRTRARERRGAGTGDAEPTGHHRHPIEPPEARALPRGPTCGSTLILVQTRRPQGRSPPCC
jgi:hypothetical protein